MENLNPNDELRIFFGEDFFVSKHIKIRNPKISEIVKYGDCDYFSLVYNLTATPQCMKSLLWDMGIDYTKITPFELFAKVILKSYPQEKTSILFGDLDFLKFDVFKRKDNGETVLYQRKATDEIYIDEFTYNIIVDYLRRIHMIEKDSKIPGNESTALIFSIINSFGLKFAIIKIPPFFF